MKKTLAGLACLGALTAQAQSSVTLYGVADIALSWTRSGQGTSLTGGGATQPSVRRLSVDSGVGPGSRIGFRGREDLGGGLAAVFLAEMGMDLSSGIQQQGGAAFGRQIFTGIQTANWSLTAGRQYSPLDIAQSQSDAFGGIYWGRPASGTGHGNYASLGSAAGSGTHNSTARVDNSVLGTATFGSWTGKLMVALGNETTNHAGRLINPHVTYAQGPLALHASYLRVKTPNSLLVAGASGEWMTERVLGGSYNFGVARVHGGYYDFEGPRNRANIAPIATPGAVGASAFAFSWDKIRSAWVSTSVPVGPGRVLVGVARQIYDYGVAADGRSWLFGAAYEHALSKRTVVYVSGGTAKNDARSKTPLSSAVAGVTPNGFGADPKAVSIGMTHVF